MWVASLPLWLVSALCLLCAGHTLYRAYLLALNEENDSDEIGMKAWLAMAFLVLCSLLAGLAVLVARL